MDFYRIYHVGADGGIVDRVNFRAHNDVQACERTVEIMAKHGWPGVELWEAMRKVHCKGVTRFTSGLPETLPI